MEREHGERREEVGRGRVLPLCDGGQVRAK